MVPGCIVAKVGIALMESWVPVVTGVRSALSWLSCVVLLLSLHVSLSTATKALTDTFASYIHYTERLPDGVPAGITREPDYATCEAKCVLAGPGECQAIAAIRLASNFYECNLMSARGVPMAKLGTEFHFRFNDEELKLVEEQRRLDVRGVLDTWKLPANGSAKPDNYFAICSIMKVDTILELVDVREWVLHYVYYFGPGKIYIYDHLSSPVPIAHALADYIAMGIVEVVPYPRRMKHHVNTLLSGFWHCLERARANRHEFVAFFDWDEFLMLSGDWKGKTMREVLKPFEAAGGLAVNWVLHGSAGHVWRPPEGVRKAYTTCAEDPKRHVKSIVKPEAVVDVSWNPHVFAMAPGRTTVTEKFEVMDGPWSTTYSVSQIGLHHMMLKSRQDYDFRTRRGNAAGRSAVVWDFFYWVESITTRNCTELAELKV